MLNATRVAVTSVQIARRNSVNHSLAECCSHGKMAFLVDKPSRGKEGFDLPKLDSSVKPAAAICAAKPIFAAASGSASTSGGPMAFFCLLGFALSSRVIGTFVLEPVSRKYH